MIHLSIFLTSQGYTPNLDRVPGIILGIGALVLIAWGFSRFCDRMDKRKTARDGTNFGE